MGSQVQIDILEQVFRYIQNSKLQMQLYLFIYIIILALVLDGEFIHRSISSKNLQRNALPYGTAKQTVRKVHVSCIANAATSALLVSL